MAAGSRSATVIPRVLKELDYSVAVPPCQGEAGAKTLSDQGLAGPAWQAREGPRSLPACARFAPAAICGDAVRLSRRQCRRDRRSGGPATGRPVASPPPARLGGGGG